MNEADIKFAIEEYLQYGMNAGKWWFSRLNSGDFIDIRGGSRRRIRGSPKGTPDFLVLMRWFPRGAPNKDECIAIFFEVKSPTGKLSKEQKEMHELLKAQKAGVFVVRSVEEVQHRLE